MRISRLLTSPLLKSPHVHKGDPQGGKLYALEQTIRGNSVHTTCPREHLQAIVNHACRKYQVPRPKLKIVNEDAEIFGSCFDDDIELNRGYHGVNAATLVHELAHWITDKLFEEDTLANHGPEFIGIYANLLNDYRLLPIQAFKLKFLRHHR